MNAATTHRTFHFLGVIAFMLALFAVAAMPGSHAAAASIGTGGGSLALNPLKDYQTARVNQTVYHSYSLANSTAAPIQVQLAAKNDKGWPVSVSGTTLVVPANSAVKFEVKVFVPPTAKEQSMTTVAVLAPAASGTVVAYWAIQPLTLTPLSSR